MISTSLLLTNTLTKGKNCHEGTKTTNQISKVKITLTGSTQNRWRGYTVPLPAFQKARCADLPAHTFAALQG